MARLCRRKEATAVPRLFAEPLAEPAGTSDGGAVASSLDILCVVVCHSGAARGRFRSFFVRWKGRYVTYFNMQTLICHTSRNHLCSIAMNDTITAVREAVLDAI